MRAKAAGEGFWSGFAQSSARLRKAFPAEKHLNLYLKISGFCLGFPQAGATARRFAWTCVNKLAHG
jgi:hypothetical protein